MNLNDRFGMEINVVTECLFPCDTCGALVTSDGMVTHNQWHNRQEALQSKTALEVIAEYQEGEDG